MQKVLVLTCAVLLAAGATASRPDHADASAQGTDAERAALARKAANPDFGAVDALAKNRAVAPAAESRSAPARSPAKVAVVAVPARAIEAAIGVSSSDDDGLATLPLAPDLLVALRRAEAIGENGNGNYTYDFLTGAQEQIPIRDIASTSRATANGMEVTSRFVNVAGPRTLVSLWSRCGDGSWQLDDLRDDQTTLSALLASEVD